MRKKIVIFITLIALALYAGQEFFTQEILKKVETKYGGAAKRRVEVLNTLMLSLQTSGESEKLEKVNAFFNQMRFASDEEIWHQKDYWATRMEFIGMGAGDCEDFVIAKYFTLKQLGISTDKLFFTYVKAIKYQQAHMVLTYFETPTSVPLVLDNINFKILPATYRNDLVPVYSFNGDALYLAKQQGLGQVVPSGMQKNKKWFDLIDKIRREEQ
ncbi:transglutaminase-like cysteine peptidase [Sulfurospirillum halorespirans]|uniref:Transglutaminase family protein n=1 Tax=Sulfurospirillum halorespirans DSM 13726 TaxID=1193502 RepID=A0A1D7TIG5_9BACT|nr:transglutaminase-like cysteine peptidase [Sulfurospirillum halorespirans]AOO64818.1 transglutaminase family protein [Sulfurospirillum halorespirans DSM 13726]